MIAKMPPTPVKRSAKRDPAPFAGGRLSYSAVMSEGSKRVDETLKYEWMIS